VNVTGLPRVGYFTTIFTECLVFLRQWRSTSEGTTVSTIAR
jgi:hypothetical protein